MCSKCLHHGTSGRIGTATAYANVKQSLTHMLLSGASVRLVITKMTCWYVRRM